MTSLREAAGGRPIDRDACSTRSSRRLEPRIDALRGGRFDVADWTARQLTTGRAVRLETPDGSGIETVRALGVDAATGRAGRRPTPRPPSGERHVLVGEIIHVRLDRARQRSGCNAMARPAFRKVDASGGGRSAPRPSRPRPTARRGGPGATRPGSRPSIGSTWPRCTATRSTSSRDHHEAEDATERTFLPALANLPRFEERARPADGEGASTFRVWLFQIARNVVAERRRRGAASPEAPLEAAARDRRARSTSRPTRRSATRPRAAWRAVARLPGDRRRALILRFVDEMSTAEIAGVLGRSEGAVRVLIHRACGASRATSTTPAR